MPHVLLLSARLVVDQLGHARPSMTQDVYFARKVVDKRAADALESAFDKPKRDADEGEEDQVEDGPPDAAA
jgi:integrase